jgi:hypothetical protein
MPVGNSIEIASVIIPVPLSPITMPVASAFRIAPIADF